jgi:hypothetical protein
VAETVLADEDLRTTLAALADDGPYSQMYVDDTSTAAFTTGTSDIVSVSGGVPKWNNTTLGTLVPLNANEYMNIWLLAIPVTSDATSQAYRYLWVTGQAASLTRATIDAETPAGVNLGDLSSKLPEFCYLARVLIRYTAGDWSIISVTELSGTRIAQVTVSATSLPLTSVYGATAGSIPFVSSGLSLTESANLFWDATNSRLGVGTSSPTGLIEVTGTQSTVAVFERESTNNGSPNVFIRKYNEGRTAVSNTHILGTLSFSGYDGSGTPTGAYMRGIVNGTVVAGSEFPTDLFFATTPAGSTTPVERLRIASTGYVNLPNSGRLRIGDATAPSYALDVVGDIYASASITSSSANPQVRALSTSSSNIAQIYAQASNSGQIMISAFGASLSTPTIMGESRSGLVTIYGFQNTGAMVIGNLGAQKLVIGTNNAARISVAATGEVTVAGAFGINGASAQTKYTVNAASTDLASVVALCNQLRTALINIGICV